MRSRIFGNILLIFLLAGLQNPVSAQDCPCCSPEHEQFDFWLGSWMVYDSSGQLVGKNEIIKAQKGCLLVESWTSARANTGTSYNYYQKADSTWNQLWIDDQGGILELEGKLIQGKMVLSSEPQKGQNGRVYINRITWEPREREVVQTWEILDDSGKVLNLLFEGYYRKKEN